MEYTINILKNGETVAPGPELFYLSDWDKMYKLYTYFFVVRDTEHLMLVDTGCGDITAINSMLKKEFGGKISFDVSEEERFDNLLIKSDIKPEDVDYVFITHLHHDHVANVGLFKNAKIIVSKKGIDAYTKNSKLLPEYYNEALFPPEPINFIINRPADKVIYVEDSKEILPGITCETVGGHTPGCMSVAIETKLGTAVCTSDIAFLTRNIEKNHHIGLFYDQWECFNSYKKIREKADIILTSHDPLLLDKYYPEGVVE